MDEAALLELERLERATTPGPWRVYLEGRDHGAGDDFSQAPTDDPDIYVEIRVADRFHPAAMADQDFIATARNLVLTLLAEIRRLRGLQD